MLDLGLVGTNVRIRLPQIFRRKLGIRGRFTNLFRKEGGGERREGREGGGEKKRGEGGRQDELWEGFTILCLEMIDYVTQIAQNTHKMTCF